MWGDIAGVLALFEGTAVISIAGVLLFSGCHLALVHFGAWTSPAFWGYSLFGRLRGSRLIALAFLLLRSLLFISFAFSPAAVQSVHLWYGLFLTICVLLLIRKIRFVPLDLLYVAACCVTLYGRGRLLDTSTVENSQMGGVLLILTGIIVLLLSLLSFSHGVMRLISNERTALKPRVMSLLGQAAVPVAVGLAVILLVCVLGKVGTITLHDRLFQNDGGKVVMYSGVNTIRRADGTCTLQPKGGKLQNLLVGPLYFEDQTGIMTTIDTILVQPVISRLNRLPSMSRVSGSGGKFTVITDGGSTVIKDFFLFDGKNTYLFAEPVTLKWGNQTLNVPAFSTINVKYGSSFEVFDRETRGLTQKSIGMDDVTVTMNCQAKVDLCSDLLYGTGGQQQMLYIQPNLLQDYK